MRYVDFRAAVHEELTKTPEGRTWAQLKAELNLPYQVPCYTWIGRMEEEIGLTRTRGPRGMIWRVP